MSYEEDDFFLTDEDEVKHLPIVEEEKEKKVSFFDLFNDISNRGDYLENYFDVKKEMPKER